MNLDAIALLRNVGQFESVDAGARLPLGRFSLVYAENGRGKTTVATILRSLGTGDGSLIDERQRLGGRARPHVVLTMDGSSVVFQNGSWPGPQPLVTVFDDGFVAANVCSGTEIATAHRQNLHELILGSQGVALNVALNGHVARIEQHNRELRAKQDSIPAELRGDLGVDAFCALPTDPEIESKIQEAERDLSAAGAAEPIQRRSLFEPLSLPSFDVDQLDALLQRSLADVEADAAARVRAHLQSLGDGGETWVGEGMARIPASASNSDTQPCPFCAQDLAASPLIRHYQVFFSQEYADLKSEIITAGRGVKAAHGGDIPAAFERDVRLAGEAREFWREFVDVPDSAVDTAAVVRAWTAAREGVLTALRAKAAAPLEAAQLSPEVRSAIVVYESHRNRIAALSADLLACNAAIGLVKERAAAADLPSLKRDLAKLVRTKRRHAPDIAALCDEYLREKAEKKRTETRRKEAREALDRYRQDIFPAYEGAINSYLQRFNAGFRLGAVSSVNSRSGSSATYHVVINDVPVALAADEGPSFRNTLSAGDRNALALAFFFASLDQEPDLEDKIVVIDDPMTSLDEHRSLTTIQEIRRLSNRVNQVIVLSHSKAFLCSLWEGAAERGRSALRIIRDGAGSTLAAWDVQRDCVTEHDRRHELVRAYVQQSDPDTEREVARALRPILEAFVRVAYPGHFPPGSLLGHFRNTCAQRLGSPEEILGQSDTDELRDLLDYANRFHHDTNPAWQTEAINDQELKLFCERTLAFTRRT